MQKRLYMKDGVGGKHPSLIVVLFVVLFVIVVILVGLYMLGASTRNSDKNKQGLTSIKQVGSSTDVRLRGTGLVSPTVISPTAVSPSTVLSLVPSSTVDRSGLKIQVMNGSGLPGAASGISVYLSGLGYTVVSVGNADSYAYRNVTVLVKKSKSSYAQLLKKDLQDKGSSVSASLSDAISSDAEVIVGK